MRSLLSLGLGFAAVISAQGVDSWLTFHGDYSGRRHSSLTEITPDNVGRLPAGVAF